MAIITNKKGVFSLKGFKLLFMMIVSLLVIGLFTITVSADDSKIMTPAEYESYLLNKSDEGALEILEGFKNLTDKEQEAFLEFMWSDEYFETLSYGTQNGEEFSVQMNEVDIPVKVSHSMDHSSSHQPASNFDSGIQSTTYRSWTTGTIDLTMFGFNTTTMSTKLTWQHNNSQALQVYSVEQTDSNYNPTFFLTKDGTNDYISNGYAYGTGTWSMTLSAAPWVQDTTHVDVRARTLDDKRKRIRSTHSNIGHTGWLVY